MTDLRSRLLQSDPVRLEGDPSPSDVARMRMHVLAAEDAAVPARPSIFVAAAAVMLVACAAAVGFVHGVAPPLETRAPVADSSTVDESSTRQLQFSTPGGTRVFWTFNPLLDVR